MNKTFFVPAVLTQIMQLALFARRADPKLSFGKFGKVGVTGENAAYFFVQSPFVLILYLAECYKRFRRRRILRNAFAKAFSR